MNNEQDDEFAEDAAKPWRVDLEEPRFNFAELPKIEISESEWTEIFRYFVVPELKKARAKRRIHEAIRRFVKSLELHAKRKNFHQARRDTVERMQDAMKRIDAFLEVNETQPKYSVAYGEGETAQNHDPEKDGLAARQALHSFVETLQTFMMMSPLSLSTGRNNQSIIELIKTLDDIVFRQSTYGHLKASRNHRLKPNVDSSAKGSDFSDLKFVQAVLELALKKSKPYVGNQKAVVSKNMEDFTLLMMKKFHKEYLLNDKTNGWVKRSISIVS
jgi:hypothetical protein